MTLDETITLSNKANMNNIDYKMFNKKYNKEDFIYPIRDMMDGTYRVRKYAGEVRGWMWQRLYLKHCETCNKPLFMYNLNGISICNNRKCRESETEWFMDDNPSNHNYGYMIKYVCKIQKYGKWKGNLHRVKIFQHRWVMEQHLGRKLTAAEQVHHIDMNKANNDLSNLWVCSRSEHGKAHYSFNRICEELMGNFNKYSDIRFNVETGKYYLIEKETR